MVVIAVIALAGMGGALFYLLRTRRK